MLELYELMEKLSSIFEIGATPPVDILPFLKYLPQSFFNNWKTSSSAVGEAIESLYDPLVSHVIQRRAKKGSNKSFLDNVLDQQDKLQLTRHELNLMCGNLTEGGSDTTSSMILVFIHAMLKYPDVQREAQKQIDCIIGEERSPEWLDYDRLPYVAMIVKETMRWRPVAPLAFPHALTKGESHVHKYYHTSNGHGKAAGLGCQIADFKQQGDNIDGLTIPKDSTVVINVWGLHNDPARYPDPERFDPLRFEGRTRLAPEYANSPDYEKRDHYAYGAGRRICPGMHLAERSMFLAIAKILWAFDVSPKLDEKGRQLMVDTSAESGYSEGFLHCPKPFEANIQVRSAKRGETILAEFARAEHTVFSQFEQA